MVYGYTSRKSIDERHKVFISYYHHDDEEYREQFEDKFGQLFINKSVQPGDIDSDLNDEYIKRLIQDEYITDSSVIVVLIGPKTHCRKHVDWEISAGLDKRLEGNSGLLGIVLPEVKLSPEKNVYNSDIPPRLLDNINSKYARLYLWNGVCSGEEYIKNAIQTAFDERITKVDKVDNSRFQFRKDLCE